MGPGFLLMSLQYSGKTIILVTIPVFPVSFCQD